MKLIRVKKGDDEDKYLRKINFAVDDLIAVCEKIKSKIRSEGRFINYSYIKYSQPVIKNNAEYLIKALKEYEEWRIK